VSIILAIGREKMVQKWSFPHPNRLQIELGHIQKREEKWAIFNPY